MQPNDNNRLNDVISSAIKNLSMITDVNTVIGEPIIGNNGEYIIPFSKVTLGVMVGGGEYGKISLFNKNSDFPYSAGNGAIISVKPCGFLIKENENCKVLSIQQTSSEKLFDKASEFIEKLNNNYD